MILPLLLTASVSTRGMKGASFTDQERESMYIETLVFYITSLLLDAKTTHDDYDNTHQYRIVFVDNSGWNLIEIKNRLKSVLKFPSLDDFVEFVSLNPCEFDISKGKGYNELLMINKTIQKSKFIGESDYFFKVTGRYPIFNLRSFLQASICHFQRHGNFYCDIKNHNRYRYLGLKWNSHSWEARLWGTSVKFYKDKIGPLYKECNDYNGRFVENVIFSHLKSFTSNFGEAEKMGISLRFKREPFFGGLEGSNSNASSFCKDQQSAKAKFKMLVGNFFRILIPWIKF